MSFKSAYWRGALLIVVGLVTQVIADWTVATVGDARWRFYTPYSVSEPSLHQQPNPWPSVAASFSIVLVILGVGIILITFWHQLSRTRSD
ncbi:MAG: hypothetical protein ACR2HJ_06245 [Fimbriimonadales bacterium]